jgi:hypothetical protein
MCAGAPARKSPRGNALLCGTRSGCVYVHKPAGVNGWRQERRTSAFIWTLEAGGRTFTIDRGTKRRFSPVLRSILERVWVVCRACSLPDQYAANRRREETSLLWRDEHISYSLCERFISRQDGNGNRQNSEKPNSISHPGGRLFPMVISTHASHTARLGHWLPANPEHLKCMA